VLAALGFGALVTRLRRASRREKVHQ
jgi:hypothetical protein